MTEDTTTRAPRARTSQPRRDGEFQKPRSAGFDARRRTPGAGPRGRSAADGGVASGPDVPAGPPASAAPSPAAAPGAGPAVRTGAAIHSRQRWRRRQQRFAVTPSRAGSSGTCRRRCAR